MIRKIDFKKKNVDVFFNVGLPKEDTFFWTPSKSCISIIITHYNYKFPLDHLKAARLLNFIIVSLLTYKLYKKTQAPIASDGNDYF